MNIPERIEFKNWLSGKINYLVRADRVDGSSEQVRQIAGICNQKEVYSLLFRENLKGEVYSESKAIEFLEWANEGWKKQSYFVFFILDNQRNILGCMDIKSTELTCAEIGYWASNSQKGNITNALLELVRMASEVGYKKLVAYVEKDNANSLRVLSRASFAKDTSLEQIHGFNCVSRNL